MKILKAMTASLMLAALPLASQAKGMDYSFVELGWAQTDIDGVSDKADGFALRGSVGFAEHYFAFADYSNQSVNSTDVDSYTVGLGGHYGLTGNLDLVGRAGWFKVKVDDPSGNFDDDGYLVSAGLRGKVGDSVELEGRVTYTDLGGSSGDETAVAVGGRYHFNENFALGAEYQDGESASTIMVGVRYSF
jgi:long-subunit fatty acid transport protein